MKSTAIICAIAAASLGFSSLSFAQGYDRRGPDQEPQRMQQHGPRQMDQRDLNRFERRMDRSEDRRFDRAEMRRNDRQGFYNARGPEFRRGGHIPREFRNRQYVVSDYRAYRLSAPPRGQQWVQVGSDYVMVAIATGLIASIVLNH